MMVALLLACSGATGAESPAPALVGAGDDADYVDCGMEIFIAKDDDDGRCDSDEKKNVPLYSGSCKELIDGGLSKAVTAGMTAASAEFPPLALVAPLITPALKLLVAGKGSEAWCTANVCEQGCPRLAGLPVWPTSLCEAEIKPTLLTLNYGMYVHAQCGFPWGFLLLILLGICGCAGVCAVSRVWMAKRRRRQQGGPFAQQTDYLQAPGAFGRV